jgi:NAD+ synthase
MDYMEMKKTDEDQLGASYDELEWAMLEEESGKSTRTGRQRKSLTYIKIKYHQPT